MVMNDDRLTPTMIEYKESSHHDKMRHRAAGVRPSQESTVKQLWYFLPSAYIVPSWRTSEYMFLFAGAGSMPGSLSRRSSICFFVSDLHGRTDRYEKLFEAVRRESPPAVFLGGDLLPSHLTSLLSDRDEESEFITGFLRPNFERLRATMGEMYPAVFLILGNDDLRAEEPLIIASGNDGLWKYIHNTKDDFAGTPVYGYAFVPPTPFHLKDWERYDVSAFVDPGCIHPSEGRYSVEVSLRELKYATIKDDLDRLAGGDDLSHAIFLFHSPPYDTNLDRAALDGKMVDHVPVDPHVGSIAIRRFIERMQPAITLHGHVHESARLTGSWKDVIGRTHCFSAAYDGNELALVRFRPGEPENAIRDLL